MHHRYIAVALFDQRGDAESAIHELLHQGGFRNDQIGIAAPGKGLEEPQNAIPELEVEEQAASGAAKGAVAGGTLGALLGGAAVALIPGVGPVLAGGILGGVLLGAATGAAAGTLVGPFVAMGLSEEEANLYQRAFQAGRTVVVVKADDPDSIGEASEILRAHQGQVTTPSFAVSESG